MMICKENFLVFVLGAVLFISTNRAFGESYCESRAVGSSNLCVISLFINNKIVSSQTFTLSSSGKGVEEIEKECGVKKNGICEELKAQIEKELNSSPTKRTKLEHASASKDAEKSLTTNHDASSSSTSQEEDLFSFLFETPYGEKISENISRKTYYSDVQKEFVFEDIFNDIQSQMGECAGPDKILMITDLDGTAIKSKTSVYQSPTYLKKIQELGVPVIALTARSQTKTRIYTEPEFEYKEDSSEKTSVYFNNHALSGFHSTHKVISNSGIELRRIPNQTNPKFNGLFPCNSNDPLKDPEELQNEFLHSFKDSSQRIQTIKNRIKEFSEAKKLSSDQVAYLETKHLSHYAHEKQKRWCYYDQGILMASFNDKGKIFEQFLRLSGNSDTYNCFFFVDDNDGSSQTPNISNFENVFKSAAKKLPKVFTYQIHAEKTDIR